MCVCAAIPYILDVRLVDAPAGVTQEEGDTGFLHLPSAVGSYERFKLLNVMTTQTYDTEGLT